MQAQVNYRVKTAAFYSVEYLFKDSWGANDISGTAYTYQLSIGARKQKVLSANSKMHYGVDIGSFVYHRSFNQNQFGSVDPFFGFVRNPYQMRNYQDIAISVALPLEFSISLGKRAILLNNALGAYVPVYRFTARNNGRGQEEKTSDWNYQPILNYVYTAEALVAFAFNARYKIHSLAVGPAILLETRDFTTETFKYSFGLAVQMRF